MSSDLVVGGKPPFLSNTWYDRLKWLALVGLPAFGTLYFGLAGYWNFPNPDKVVGSILVIDTFLGLVLGFSTKTYNNSDVKFDGALVVNTQDDSVPTHQLEFKAPLEDLEGKSELTLKVQNPN